MSPSVSVIIPTRERPAQLLAAVNSVLTQRLASDETLELIVVVDGRDDTTAAAFAGIDDPRVRMIRLSNRRGHATARNAGINAARGRWCAFLDDDDTWLPDKITAQLQVANRASSEGIAHPVVGCIVRAKSEETEMLWPVRTPGEFEPIAHYLYARSGWRSIMTGHTLLQTSMILLQTELARKVGFRGGMRRHADPDWLMRLQLIPGVRFLFPQGCEPLAEWNIAGPGRVSSTGDYRYSMIWARQHAGLLGTRALAGFLTGPAAHVASQIPHRTRRRRAFAVLLREAFESGDPVIWDLAAIAVKYFGIQGWRGRTKPHRTSGDSR